jgi:hypothetical protein
MYENKRISREFKYRQTRTLDPNVYHDIFDGAEFKALLDRNVTWGDQVFPQTYFETDTDIALGAMTDGVPCFKRNGLDCWPLILNMYSMRPELRQRKEYKICCVIIPGESACSKGTNQN